MTVKETDPSEKSLAGAEQVYMYWSGRVSPPIAYHGFILSALVPWYTENAMAM